MSDGHHTESPEVIAKELTLAAIQKIASQNIAMGTDKIGDTVGEIYKKIYKHVRSAGKD